MSSTFAGLTLFNSGPHRFIIKPVGRTWLPPLKFDAFTEITVVLAAPLELAIIQTGRLVAASDASLWSLVDTIQSSAESALNGVLVDHSGRQWANMTMLRFKPDDRVDRGRSVSLAYTVDYIRLVQPAPLQSAPPL